MCEVADRLENIGLAKGRAEGRAEIIKKLLQSGMTVEDISNRLGGPIEEIEAVEADLVTSV